MKIESVQTGIPQKTATDLLIRVMPFETDAVTCGLYYWLTTESGEQVAEGNLYLTEQEFTDWGQSMDFIESIVLSRLGLTRKEE